MVQHWPSRRQVSQDRRPLPGHFSLSGSQQRLTACPLRGHSSPRCALAFTGLDAVRFKATGKAFSINSARWLMGADPRSTSPRSRQQQKRWFYSSKGLHSSCLD